MSLQGTLICKRILKYVEKLKISHTIPRIFQDMQIFSCISCCPVFGQWTLNFLSGSHSLRHTVSKANPFSQDKLQDAEKKFLFFINFSHRNFSSKMPNKNYTLFFINWLTKRISTQDAANRRTRGIIKANTIGWDHERIEPVFFRRKD